MIALFWLKINRASIASTLQYLLTPQFSFHVGRGFDRGQMGYSNFSRVALPITRSANAGGLASGVYLYRLKASEFVDTRKLILLR